MPSTITEPLTARLRVDDVIALHEIALRDDTTVSTLIREIIAGNVPRIASDPLAAQAR
jgi:hypothetical protein